MRQKSPKSFDARSAFGDVLRAGWDAVRRRADYSAALDCVDGFLANLLTDSERSRALGFRAMILESAGRLDEERAALQLALHFSRPHSVNRHYLQLGLARNARELGNTRAQLRWLRLGLETIADVPVSDGGAPGVDLLDLTGGELVLHLDDRRLLERVVANAHVLLGLNLTTKAESIREALVAIAELARDRVFSDPDDR